VDSVGVILRQALTLAGDVAAESSKVDNVNEFVAMLFMVIVDL
jgi:hypothetical protein